MRFFSSNLQIIYAESPTVTALLRADVTRYLEFRFVSRLLAFTVLQSSATEHPESESSSDAKTTGDIISSEPQEHHMEGARLVQVWCLAISFSNILGMIDRLFVFKMHPEAFLSFNVCFRPFT